MDNYTEDIERFKYELEMFKNMMEQFKSVHFSEDLTEEEIYEMKNELQRDFRSLTFFYNRLRNKVEINQMQEIQEFIDYLCI